MPSAIDQAIQVRLIATAPGPQAVPAVLHYHPDDPFAVRISFPPEISLDGAEVDWIFARDLLASGLAAPAGQGDVRVEPAGRSRTLMEFHVPDGVAMVQMRTEDLHCFLERSYQAVPAGQEDAHLHLDGDLTELFGAA
ncbi:SsgA family sporulation/cell division regulator [Streptomyces sp. NPDC059740]|uniref:SsgA family sporulation/cell division regulator n=1 Tax=Streptomyces sp. NPDC059740 TaxID=3346926 RepID=UPI0036693FBC